MKPITSKLKESKEIITLSGLIRQACCRLVSFHFRKNPGMDSHWLNTLNPLLGNVTPMSMLLRGKEKKLLKFILNQLDENKLP